VLTLADVRRALAPASGGRGTCRDTDPLLRLTETVPCGPVGAPPGGDLGYVARTAGRRAAMQQLDELCFWHLLLTEIPPDSREITAARRELHVRLKNDQLRDDLAYAREGNR